MRHSNSGRKLSRTPAHRKALLHNLAKALLIHGKIRTTEMKAKELRRVVEPLITLAKRNDLHARRQAYRVLNDHSLVKRLFDEIGPVFAGVPGGYTRVLKLAMPRKGDNAPMAIIELSRVAEPAADDTSAQGKKAAAAEAAPAKEKKGKTTGEPAPAEALEAKSSRSRKPKAEKESDQEESAAE